MGWVLKIDYLSNDIASQELLFGEDESRMHDFVDRVKEAYPGRVTLPLSDKKLITIETKSILRMAEVWEESRGLDSDH